ncbi:hypothetical protein [Algibacter sp. L3A6]|uniref:hypothetical protein n=1 Tax=Algibacter sp. L3A6 TaxID=2686366 RepID=UPI00131C8039|nr:hypothetical protein [Algibacter sp. L3A6]
MEFYTCEYCYKEFDPKRRRVQKYCSNSCRSKAHHARKKTDNTLATIPEEKQDIDATIPKKTKVDSMSLAGTGNAIAGVLAVDGIKALFTSTENKPATKGDLENLKKQIVNRYHKITNLQQRNDGALPYYDMYTGEVVYSFYVLG